MILTFDAAWTGIAWVLYDGQCLVARGWRAFPKPKRSLTGVCQWLDRSLLPAMAGLTIHKVAIETTNVFGVPEDEEGNPQSFMLQYQVEVIRCATVVGVWCVMMGLPEPVFVLPQTWRASYKKLIPKPRPKGQAEWKAWSVKLAPQLVPGCLRGCGKKEAEDTADAILLAMSM